MTEENILCGSPLLQMLRYCANGELASCTNAMSKIDEMLVRSQTVRERI